MDFVFPPFEALLFVVAFFILDVIVLEEDVNVAAGDLPEIFLVSSEHLHQSLLDVFVLQLSLAKGLHLDMSPTRNIGTSEKVPTRQERWHLNSNFFHSLQQRPTPNQVEGHVLILQALKFYKEFFITRRNLHLLLILIQIVQDLIYKGEGSAVPFQGLEGDLFY